MRGGWVLTPSRMLVVKSRLPASGPYEATLLQGTSTEGDRQQEQSTTTKLEWGGQVTAFVRVNRRARLARWEHCPMAHSGSTSSKALASPKLRRRLPACPGADCGPRRCTTVASMSTSGGARDPEASRDDRGRRARGAPPGGPAPAAPVGQESFLRIVPTTSNADDLGRRPDKHPDPEATMATPTPGTGRRWTSHRRRWMVGVVVGALAVSGTLQTTGAGAADTAASTATTLTEAHLTLSAWKHHYESAVGVIVGDIFIVVATGEKESKNPTKKSEEAASVALPEVARQRQENSERSAEDPGAVGTRELARSDPDLDRGLVCLCRRDQPGIDERGPQVSRHFVSG